MCRQAVIKNKPPNSAARCVGGEARAAAQSARRGNAMEWKGGVGKSLEVFGGGKTRLRSEF